MRIRFHLRMAVISSFSRACIKLAAVMAAAVVLCLGQPLDLSSFFPAAFAEFFLWLCAFPLLTAGAALGAVIDIASLPFWEFLSSESVQMVSIGALALASLLAYWAFVRYVVFQIWGTDWVKAATTIVKCFIFWGYFQLLCAFVSYAWVVGGLKLKGGAEASGLGEVRQVQTVVPEVVSGGAAGAQVEAAEEEDSSI